ncbi:bifunctional 4-hydroxy-2-oxoglutarate aldolase/2-dehydro-3-deoxy-phosphogluconate aldolase [Agromyces archimandritae]|uniref:Bifunctional 4-hydroxy-2-oxoglutarate aldolase/2-dehydro-3-deoxy-phosphogluconate aldolase n=1 Tax=Agromyces archimandritae TaxID=2781962 RepID=A0A975FK25_9MICO|nr:bifunctional 4-hydroxy-2-oxoglutarate aldolase/2-dehydro-3-deoxy-phosphogluconate aldolase [Agromyces archimandritae]QTX03504.1 bifunctional 4-hydroxy-2-oxoglutarate aldolase/2-dehydro-3-deoxy-phosphogluconate aldolase [Agromyces archimandritae]
MTDQLAPARRTGVIAVLRAASAEAAVRASEALVAGGVTGLEITYSTPDAPTVIAELTARFGDAAYIGAGTVTTPAQAEAAAEAGARFLVSPGTRPDLARAMLATGLTTMTGALTPSEVMEATELGVHVVKIFPASLGGPGYLKALRGPFPDAPLMPTGGVTPGNLSEWFAAGSVAVGAGGDLVSGADLAAGRYDEVERKARLFAAALAAVRG